jgi:tetratricopeptide (TPR) repeat protein
LTNQRLAQVLIQQGRLREAEVLIVDALQKQTALFGEKSSQTAWILDDMAEISWRRGHVAEAEAYSRRSVAAASASLGEIHGATASYMLTLGAILLDEEKYTDAEAVFRSALNVFIATKVADHEYIASAEYFLGKVYLATARPAEAESVLRTSMERWQRSGAPSWRATRSASALGEALYRLGRTTEGRQYVTASAVALSRDPKAEKRAIDEARARVARYVDKTPAQQDSITRLVSGERP